jgi:HSP20 family protein
MAEKDLQVQEKQELATQAESTRNLPTFVPPVDIYESDDALHVLADMPGVGRESISIDLHDNQLTIHGTVTLEGETERMLLQEYAMGDYHREFSLGRIVDQSKIEASLKDGVLMLTLPKAEVAKPRKIEVKTS